MPDALMKRKGNLQCTLCYRLDMPVVAPFCFCDIFREDELINALRGSSITEYIVAYAPLP